MVNIYKIRIQIDNMMSLSYYILIIFLFAGSFISLQGDWWVRKVSADNIHKAFTLFHLSLIWFSLAVFFYTSFKDKIPVKDKNIQFRKGIEKLIFPLLIIIIVLVLLIFFLPDSALMAFLKRTREAEDLARIRGDQGYYFEGPKIILYFRNLVMGPLLLYMVAFYGIYHYMRHGYTKWFRLLIVLTAFMLILDLSKAPVVILILLIFLLRYRYAGNPIKVSKFLLIGGVVLIFVYSIAFNISVWESVPRILHRLTVSQYAGFPNALEVFPLHHDYLGINTISGSVSRMFGQEYVAYSRVLMEFANPSGVEQGTAGYMSTYYLAEAYAIGGIWMFAAAAILTPLLLALIDFVFRRTNDVFFQAFYMVLLIKLPFILIDGFTRIFINQELIFLFIAILTISYLNNIARKYQHD